MKANFLFIIIFISSTINCFSQVKQRTTNLQQNKIIASPVTQPKAKAVSPVTNNKVMLDAHKDMTIQVDRTNATLLDVFAYVYTGFDDDLGCGKDGDTHWSFGLFDENDKPIASFHDDSDNDIYEPTTGRTVKMHIDDQAKFSDFTSTNSGRIHVNIAPNGHDTWDFEKLALTFDFINPNFTLKISLAPGVLSQDHRDADLYFYYDGNNFVPR